MTNNQDNKLVSWDDHLNSKYGVIGTPTREKYEAEFENFKIGVLIQDARKQQNITQEELAIKSGTTKNYISRIENDASDIWLSTLMRIIREGLGGRLKISLELYEYYSARHNLITGLQLFFKIWDKHIELTAIELKSILVHKITEIDDILFLKAIKTILDSKTKNEILYLTDARKNEIIATKNYMEQGLFIEHNELDKEINELLRVS